MVTIKGILKDNRNEAGSIKKQIRYSQAQIKKKPAKWVVKEYRGVIKDNRSRLSELERHNKKLKLLSKRSK